MLLPLVVTVPLAGLTAPAAVAALNEVVRSEALTSDAALAAAPLWLALAPLIAAAWKLHRDRRDRLHGGELERTVADAIGPLELLRITRARAREEARGPLTDDGILFGVDHRGAPLRVPQLQAHATIVGASNSGKTNTAVVLLEAQAAGGGGFVVLDGKGGRDLPQAALALGARYRRPVALWSVQPYADAKLDELRLPWNVVGGGTPTEIKDRIAATEEQREPYYRAIASRGLLAATTALASADAPIRLDDVAALLERPADLLAALGGRIAASDDARWLTGLTEGERSALRGMGTRLRTMIASDGGAALLPSANGREIDLLRAIRDGWLVVFTLPQGTYPELVPHVARYVLQALNGVCSRIEGSVRPANGLVFVDELSAFDGDELCAGLERGRSAGVRFVVATQSLSNFAAAGGEKLLHAALDNAELLVIHRQAVPDSAELLAQVGGTEEAWEHTHVVADGAGYRVGWDETGARQRRLADRFRVHPNVVKTLACGEAIVISQRSGMRVRRVRVRLAAQAPPGEYRAG
jgi:conjugal transfer pilus assembly protein TraD